jgi:toxin secretion/phage lysis holin
MRELAWKTILAAVSAGILTWFGGWDMALRVLITLMAIDIISGFVRAFVQGKLSSKESFRGMAKKFLILVIVALAVQADLLAGAAGVMRGAAIAFYCGSESISIVENVVAAGVPVPESLRNGLAQLNQGKANPSSKTEKVE